MSSSKPRVFLLATGGTIAGTAASATATAAYSSGILGVDTLIKAVPQMKQFADVRGEQVCNVGSPDIDSMNLVKISQTIQRYLADPKISGVVVTHGTDTLEGSAFFLDLTINSDKPVIIAGAMRPVRRLALWHLFHGHLVTRPSTSLSADGPLNLLEAVRLAADKNARKRGVMVVLNDRIFPARFVTKTNANRVEAFTSDASCIGTFENSEPHYFYPPVRAIGWKYFDINKLDAKKPLPQVTILYGHLEADNELLQAALKSGAKGIVLAGMGCACWTTAGGNTLASLIKKKDKFPVVASYRPAYGFVDGANEIYGLEKVAPIGSGYLNAPKARIQLQICLASGLDVEKIKAVFEHK